MAMETHANLCMIEATTSLAGSLIGFADTAGFMHH